MPSTTLTYDNKTRDHFVTANDHANLRGGSSLTPKQRIRQLVRDFIFRQLDIMESETNANNLAVNQIQWGSEVDFS